MVSKPLIVVICLDEEGVSEIINDRLYTVLARKDEVLKATSLSEARRHLTSTIRPHAVIVADDAVTYPRNREVLLRLVEYAKAGGTVVYAGTFSSSVRHQDLDSMFKDVWGLPWRAFSFATTTHTVNPRVQGLNPNGLVKRYVVDANHIDHVALEDAVYLPSSVVKKLRKGGHQSAGQTYRTPAAFATVGRGRVGYIGDVDGDDDTTRLVIAMCFWPGSRAPVPPGDGVAEVVSILMSMQGL
ncbi:hypothetical protein BD309DRAFT_861448 [Dichomitus squalens]|uniref:Uncharacterized protein n=1 Tax=Dichomitus squalens TaxID=114155 RepID=A0A4Q9NXH6_9APHY|nr:hypothetical protein BD311DRAFT_666635 [Dichomitus squalens]TBU44821.1 hypothetical protein BD309DRAFT_861448 [Dichomitus squalens]TBU56103.1 hypothetical protein BD310DRAFT_824431 [Dichomitus squalens]